MKKPRWRAPREDGAVLVEPPWDQLPGVVERNQRLVQLSPLRLGGHSLAEVREQAAAELTALCTQYADGLDLRVPEAPLTRRPLIATGHQPELFHPGVLVKNFAVAALAQRLGGVGLNFNVDADVAKEMGLKLPVNAEDHFEDVLYFSNAQSPLPYEEWYADDETSFARLAEEASRITRRWPWWSVLDGFWDQAVRAAVKTRNVPERWLLARHHLETSWGVVNHELPLSRLCGSDFFGLLLGTMVEQRVELAAVYNEELALYRRAHKIRSRHHPVADLEVSSDRVELPFWAWKPGTTQRGRLFVRSTAIGLEFVVALPGQEVAIPGTWPADVTGFRQRWPELRATSWKIRPKALITTMMLRLFVADLFIHGIGGAVYDELTDRIFRRFFGTELPAFAVVTATLRLPWGERPVGAEDERRLQQRLRAMYWNPDRFVPVTAGGAARQKVDCKQELIRQAGDVTALRERHEQFAEIRDHLRPYVAEQERRTEVELHATHHHRRRDDHRFSREHAWVLYPEEALLRLRDWFHTSPSHASKGVRFKISM